MNNSVLILTPFERVGSTWLLDVIDRIGRGYTEIFRQHLGSSATDKPFNKLWLDNFSAWQSFPEKQFFKETNLFLELEEFLDFFPSDTPLILLTRDFRGIVSSFKKGALYERWQYADKFEEVRSKVESNRNDYLWITKSTDTGNWLDVLTSLFLINALEIERLVLTSGRFKQRLDLGYEEMVVDQKGSLRRILKFVGYKGPVPEKKENDSVVESDFNTSKRVGKNDWMMVLNLDEVEFIQKRIAERLISVTERMGRQSVENLLKLGWKFDLVSKMEIDRLMPVRKTRKMTTLAEADLSQVVVKKQIEYIKIAAGTYIMGKRDDRRCLEEKAVAVEEFGVSKHTITNQQFASFLNDLKKSGVENTIGRNYLFHNPNMPATRGGRIFETEDSYRVLSGFENHPVNWVSWLGAAVFARWVGGRLLTEAEWELIANRTSFDKDENLNTSIGDTIKVDVGGDEDGLKQWWGNVKTWCDDWYYPAYEVKNDLFLMKNVRGGAWNCEKADVYERNYKPYLIGARSIGIRVAKAEKIQEFSVEALAKVIGEKHDDESVFEINRIISKLASKGQ